jgi:uncharacterized membrane protein YgcG
MRRPSPALTALFAILAVAACATFIAPRPAHACGGLFCSASAPVNQAAERIIFAHGSDGMFTAVIQIQYQGPSERFSWVLPVPGVPEVGVSSDLAFQRLTVRTNPVYSLSTQIEGECRRESIFDAGMGSGGFDVANSAQDMGADVFEPPVVVLDSGSVGPYDYDVIGVEGDSEDPAGAAVRWLERNGYDVTAIAPDILRSYLDEGMNLVAFRLTKSDSVGSIRPVTLRYADECPSIPLRPTAVAANPDMGVMVWILGESRAVPTNYYDLELNEAYINWFSPGSTYNQVVTLAADEAGGHGFVTELAAETDFLAGALMSDVEERQWAAFLEDAEDTDNAELISYSATIWGSWDGYLDALGESLPLPEGVSAADAVRCIVCGASVPGDRGFDAGRFCTCDFDWTAAALGLNREQFLIDLEDLVIEPMRATQALFDDTDVVTRLYSTLSPSEMTVDPEFDFNEQLGMVSNVHTATRIIECSPAVYQWEAPWRVELESGDVVRGTGGTWPFGAVGEMPRNLYVRDMDTQGRGNVVSDNAAAIAAALDEHNETIPGPPDGPSGPGGGGGSNGGGSGGGGGGGSWGSADSGGAGASPAGGESAGCQTAAGSRPAGHLLWLLGAALVAVTRRRGRA